MAGCLSETKKWFKVGFYGVFSLIIVVQLIFILEFSYSGKGVETHMGRIQRELLWDPLHRLLDHAGYYLEVSRDNGLFHLLVRCYEERDKGMPQHEKCFALVKEVIESSAARKSAAMKATWAVVTAMPSSGNLTLA